MSSKSLMKRFLNSLSFFSFPSLAGSFLSDIASKIVICLVIGNGSC